jgi:MFS family permease
MPLLLGPLLAPFIGGLLVSHLSWRFIFYINAPFAFLTLLATLWFVDNYTLDTKPFNWPSYLMLIIFLTATAYWLDTTLEIARFSQQLINIVVILVAFFIYFLIEKNSTYKIINYHLLNIRTYNLCFLSSAISRITLGARAFVIVLYLQITLQMSPTESGVLISSMAAGYLFSRIFINQYLKRVRFKRALVWCNGGTIILTLLLCFIREANFFAFIVIIALGFFSAVILLLLNVLCFSDVNQEEYASATSLNSTTQQLFVSIGVSLAAGCLYLFNYIYGAFTIASFQGVFICIAIVSLLGQFPFLRMHDTDGDNLLT